MLTELPTHDQELVRLAIAKVRRATRRKPLVLFTAVRPEALEALGEALAGGTRSTVSVIRDFRRQNEAACSALSDRLFYRFATHFIRAFDMLKEEQAELHAQPDLVAFSPATVGQRLELEPDQVERLIRDGQLATVSLGGITRIPAASLRRLLTPAGTEIPKRERLALRDR